MQSLGFTDPELHMRDYIENHLTIDKAFYNFVKKYSSKFKFTLLSNDVLDWNRYILQYYDIQKYFTDIIVSAEVHTRKPERLIYELTLSQIGSPANECLFIDNSVKNLAVANEYHIDTVLFNRDGESYNGKTVYSFEELDELLSGMI